MSDAPSCCRCYEDFPLIANADEWRMGILRPLERAPQRIRDQYREWLGDDERGYLCGNCYFDLTDDE